MAVHDNERHVEAALDSILEQSWHNLEVILVDDASRDRSAEILRDYAHSDPRVRLLVNEQNLGLTRSLNRALDEVRGRLVARMDGDDISLPGRLAAQVEAFALNPGLVLSGTATISIDEAGRHRAVGEWPADPRVLRWYSVFRPAVAHPSAMFRASLVHQGIRYDEGLRTAQDYDFWSRLLQHGDGTVLETPLLLYRQHARSISTIHRAEQAETAAAVCQANLLREFPAFFAQLGDEHARAIARFVHGSAGAPPHEATAALTSLLALEAQHLRRLDSVDGAARREVQRLTARWVVQALLPKGRLGTGERLRVLGRMSCRLRVLIEAGRYFALRRLRARLH